jgi:tRNA threonylcarbamoyl adenosine modification protein (Sua5/YciO/YrdC/YwlC family)
VILEINPRTPEPRKIRQVVEALESGAIIAYPTDTVYGLGCDLFNKKAVDRLYKVKGMARSQQLAFVCNDLAEVGRYAVVHDYEYRILKEHLPGPYCFILNASREVPKVVQNARKHVGIRVPEHAIPQRIVEELGRPIISSTAARSGEVPHVDVRELLADFPGVDLAIDGGPGGTQPTTVIDLTGDRAILIREGAGDPTPFVSAS